MGASASRSGSHRTGTRRSQPTNAEIIHSWPGVVGPRPTILSFLSLVLIASIFAHLVFDLPSWWPFAAGGVALTFNLALAFWQAGSVRVVAVTESGIRVMRKARWRSHCTHLVGTMPRMPLGPVSGRWSRSAVANTVMWVHRRHHRIIVDFDSRYLSTFSDWNSGQTARARSRSSVLEGEPTTAGQAHGERVEPGGVEQDQAELQGPAVDQLDGGEVTVDR